MKAITLTGFGGPEVFAESEIPKPEMKDGHLLVRVAATSVKPVDYKIRSGLLAAIAPEAPTVLGCDVAGVIEAVGNGVIGFSPGDEVFGCAGGVKGCPGALAEYQLADASLIARKPESLTFDEAAALPLVAITAWDGLFDMAHLDQRVEAKSVLVYGGTGGVGHVALQLAKHAGSKVFATASTPGKQRIVSDLGATPVPYQEKTVEQIVEEHTGGRGFDLVFDSVGGDNVVRCFRAAANRGTVVSINTRCTADLSPLHQKSLSLHVVFMLLPMLTGEGRPRHGEILREIAFLADAGALRPLIGATFPMAEAGKAHALLESGGVTGKIVLRW